MPEFVQRLDRIQYDGTNGPEALEFFSKVNGPEAVWSIDSEGDGSLVLRCEFPGGEGPFGAPPPTFLTIAEGDVFMRAANMTGTGSYQGPWPDAAHEAAFASAPTAEEFAALEARVAALETPQEAP